MKWKWTTIYLVLGLNSAFAAETVVDRPANGPGEARLQARAPAAAAAPVLDDQEWAFLTLINQYRAQNGRGPLEISIALENSARWMSNDMAAKNYFSHTDSLGRSPGTRIADFGYTHSWGENIAAGNDSAQEALDQWINACDPDGSGNCTFAHRQNMLNPSYVVMGIARAFNAASTYKWYWTNDFGAFKDAVITPPPQQTTPSRPKNLRHR